MFTKTLLPPKILIVILLIAALTNYLLHSFHITTTPFNAAGHTRTARCLYYRGKSLGCTIDWRPVTTLTTSGQSSAWPQICTKPTNSTRYTSKLRGQSVDPNRPPIAYGHHLCTRQPSRA